MELVPRPVVPAAMGRLTLRVHAPCSESWRDMPGSRRERLCTRCSTQVHDLSAMSETEALALLSGPSARVCARFDVASDGSVVTAGGWRDARWLGRSWRAAGLVALAVAYWTAVVIVQVPWRSVARRLAGSAPATTADPARQDLLDRQRRLIQAARGRVTMGLIAPQERDRLRAEHLAATRLDATETDDPR